MNKSYAVCNKTDNIFEKGNVYKIVGIDNPCVLILNYNNEQFSISIDDPDFTFLFNLQHEAVVKIMTFCGNLDKCFDK